MKKRIFTIVSVVLFLSAILILLFTFISFSPIEKNSPSQQLSTANSSNQLPTAYSPLEFVDPRLQSLTITYLKEQNYTSQLQILDPLETFPNYTTHLASYTASGLTLYGLLASPSKTPSPGGFPAIVFVHGYQNPRTYYSNGRSYRAYWQALANAGYVVFKIDLRGHGNSQGDPSGAYYSGDYIIDTLSAYNALQNYPTINPNKIGLWGHSMAGNIILRSLAVQPNIPTSVIWAGAGYSYEDLNKYRIQDDSYVPSTPRPNSSPSARLSWHEQIDQVNGSITGYDSPFWRQLAPTNYLHTFTGALQLHHAINDSVVNVGYSRDLVKLLEKTTINYDYHEYATGGHDIAGASFNQAMTSTIDFFDTYLKN